MVYHNSALHNYFNAAVQNTVAVCYNVCGISAEHDVEVGCNTVESTSAFLYSDIPSVCMY